MKKIVLFIIAMAVYQISYQQGGGDTSPTIFNGVGSFSNLSGPLVDVNAVLLNSNGLKFSTNKKVEGTPFISSEWNLGFIQISKGVKIDSIQIRYNALNNELHFRDGEKEYFIEEGYSQFGYAVANKNDQTRIFFRNGFPPNGKNTLKTNYHVLAGTDVLLLKSITKDFHEMRSLDGQTFYRISDEEAYYVYNAADNSLTKIRKGVQQLEADLPMLKDKISSICAKENLKCKTEADLIRLFSSLSEITDKKKAF